ncbi:MAG: hypothetical protein CMH64_00955 [Nanoarchaeota archaeon]|nr:hypothetical protein [Nanoarchaeota archaeon]
MVNSILKLFNDPVEILSEPHPTFPLAGEIGIPEAFEGDEPNWDMLRVLWGDSIYINGNTPLEWKEVVATIPNLDEILANSQDKAPITFPIYKTDSFTIQAQRKGKFSNRDYLETGIHGFVKIDNKLLIGVRGGSESIGELIAVPSGAVLYGGGSDIISDAVYHEAMEEAGICKNSIRDLNLIGIFRQDTSTPSNMFVYTLQLEDGTEILENHTRIMELYNRTKSEFRGTPIETEFAAREALKVEAKLNGDPRYLVDAWENEKLELISNEPDAICGRVREVVNAFRLKHSMYGSLFTYFMNEFGQKYAEGLMDLPTFRDNLVIPE